MQDRLKRVPADLWPLLGFWVVPLVLFASVTFGNRTLIPFDNLTAYEPWASAASDFGFDPPTSPQNELLSDLVLQNYPWKRFTVQAIQSRQIPLWNPYLFAGVPFLASGQHSILYPFSLLFYVLPLSKAYGWFMVLQYALAGSFTYGLARILGQQRGPAFVSGLIYQSSLFMLVSVVFPMIVAGAIWLPLELLACELILRQQRVLDRPATLPWMSLGAFALGMQVLAGHPEVIYYSGLIMGGYSAWRMLPYWREWRRLVRPAVFLVAMVIFGMMLGGVQLVPLVEAVSNNFRSGSATLQEVLGWGFPTRRLLTFALPNFFGNPAHHGYWDLFTLQWTPVSVNAYGDPIQKIDWGIKNYVEGGAYVGLLPLALAALGLWGWLTRRKQDERFARPAIPFMGLLAALSLAFAFGTPLYAIIYYLPGLNQLHSPFRWVWPFSLAIAVLAGFGASLLLELPRRVTRWLGIAFAAAGLGAWGGVLVVRTFYAQFEPLVERVLADLALAPQAFADGRMFFSYESQWLLLFGLVAILSAIALWRTARPHGLLLLAAVIAFDLGSAGWSFAPAVERDIITYRPPVVEFLKQDTSPWRFTTYDPEGRKTFNANGGWYFDMQDVRGYDSIIPKQYAEYMGLIEPQNELQFNRIAPLSQPASLDSPLVDLLNIKYVITEVRIDNPKYDLVYDGEVLVYENLAVSPRAFWLSQGCGLQASSFGEAVQHYDPRHYIILDGPDTQPGLGVADCQPAPARITFTDFNTVVVDLDTTERGYLLLADSYAEGWRVYRRPFGTDETAEQRLELLRANGNFRAVELEPGNHTVRFRYSPRSFQLGGLLSGLALITTLLLAGFWLWRLVYRDDVFSSAVMTVAKNSIAPMALNLTNRFLDLLFAAFYLRVLGPGDAGNYYTAIVIIGWFDIWINFGLNTWLTREASRDRDQAPQFFSNTTIFRLVLAGATLPVFLGGLWAYQRFTGGLGDDTLLAIVLLAIGMVPSSISAGLTALFYAYEKAEYPAAIASVATLIKITLGVGALVAGFGFVGLAGVSIVVNTITVTVLGVLVWRLFFRPKLVFNRDTQRQMVGESFPLMINHLLATVFFKSDVPMIRAIRGDVAVGKYGAAYKFIDAYNIIPSFFTIALFPVMSRQAISERDNLARSYHFALKLLVGVAVPLAVVTTVLATPMVGLLGGSEFLPAGAIALQLMVWSIPFGWINSVTNYLLISLDQQRMLTRAFVVGVTFNIVTNLIFIPIYGFAAAAVTTIFSEIVEGAAFQLYVSRELGPVPWLRLFWRIVVAGVGMGATAWLGAQVHPLLGALAGGLVYLVLVITLGVFDTRERATLLQLVPGPLRTRLAALRYFAPADT